VRSLDYGAILAHTDYAVFMWATAVKCQFGTCTVFPLVLFGAIKFGGQMAKKTTQAVHVRMPKELHRKIQREADRHGQTINAEILVRLEQSFESNFDSLKRSFDSLKTTMTEAINGMVAHEKERDAALEGKFQQSSRHMAQTYQKLAKEASEEALKRDHSPISDTGTEKEKGRR
jgi:hypothetical protein